MVGLAEERDGGLGLDLMIEALCDFIESYAVLEDMGVFEGNFAGGSMQVILNEAGDMLVDEWCSMCDDEIIGTDSPCGAYSKGPICGADVVKQSFEGRSDGKMDVIVVFERMTPL